jgi:hydrogenase maturation protease
MNQALVDRIVTAVLYEGYILYPYRPFAVKNRQRWTFGGLYPESFCELQSAGADAASMQTECLLVGSLRSRLDVNVRFLHLTDRRVGQRTESELRFQPVPSLQVGDKLYQTWQEAVERTIPHVDVRLSQLLARAQQQTFQFPAERAWETLTGVDGQCAGVIVREQRALRGEVVISAEDLGEGLFKVTLRVLNRTSWPDATLQDREEALLRSLVSTHAILGVRAGDFVSLLDPPEAYRAAATACRNVGTWPVLAGEDGERDTLLSSPIILYDYPQLAPESPGDLFDSTEIDEMLTLRVLTMTDEEKRAMAAVDERARAILERTETLGPEQLLQLHGTIRGFDTVSKTSQEAV